MPALNNAQLEILKLFKYERTEEELFELKKFLSEFLFNKAIALADEVYDEKGYTPQDIENWKDEHTRINIPIDESSN